MFKGLTIESNMQPTLYKHICGFQIYESRYKEIVTSLNEKKLEKDFLTTEEYEQS